MDNRGLAITEIGAEEAVRRGKGKKSLQRPHWNVLFAKSAMLVVSMAVYKIFMTRTECGYCLLYLPNI